MNNQARRYANSLSLGHYVHYALSFVPHGGGEIIVTPPSNIRDSMIHHDGDLSQQANAEHTFMALPYVWLVWH
jgi:hypothetical protein